MENKNPHTEGAGASVVNVVADTAVSSTRDIVSAIDREATDAQCIAHRIRTLAVCADDTLDLPSDDEEIRQRLGRLGDLVTLIAEQAKAVADACERIEMAAFKLRKEGAQ